MGVSLIKGYRLRVLTIYIGVPLETLPNSLPSMHINMTVSTCTCVPDAPGTQITGL